MPCRDICEGVRSSCINGLRQQGLSWPSEHDCQLLLENTPENVCAAHSKEGTKIPSDPRSSDPKACKGPSYEDLECPAELKMPPGDDDSRHQFQNIHNCAAPCKDHFWNPDEISLARKWILGWSVLCCLSTLFTVATYCIDRNRFNYPERPIVFLAGKN